MSDLALMRSITEDAGNPSTIVLRDRSKHTFTDIPSGIDSMVAGSETLINAPMYATNRAFAYKQLSATLGVMVWSTNATTHPAVQAVVWTGTTPALGAAVQFDAGTAYPDKGCTYTSIARLGDNRAWVCFKYAGRSESVHRVCTVSNTGVVTMEDTGEWVSGAVTVPMVCECSDSQVLIVYDRSAGTSAAYLTVDVDGVINQPAGAIYLDSTVTVAGDPCAAKISPTRWLVVWRGYKSTTPIANYISVVELYDNAGVLTMGTINNIETATSGEGAFGRHPAVCLADADTPTCVVLYSDATGQDTTQTWMRVITLVADHTNTASAATSINSSVSNNLDLIACLDDYVFGCYRPTESGVNQNDISVFSALIEATASIPAGLELWGNGEDAVTECVLGLTGTVDPVIMFVDTASGSGFLQVFDATQGSGGLTDTPVGLIQIRAQRSDDYTIGSFKQSGGADVRNLTTFKRGG